jgi:hypothetical protein
MHEMSDDEKEKRKKKRKKGYCSLFLM